MPRQIWEILASVRETGDRGRNTGAPGKYGRSGNPRMQWRVFNVLSGLDVQGWLGCFCRKIRSEVSVGRFRLILRLDDGCCAVLWDVP